MNFVLAPQLEGPSRYHGHIDQRQHTSTSKVESVDEEEVEPPKETQPLLKEVKVADAPVVTYQEHNGYYDNDEVE
jgi:hypothetical protein